MVGFITFYIIPYSFIFQELSLFFMILNLILISMVAGLAMLSQLLQSHLERLLLRCCVWGHTRRLLPIVMKNLSAHRGRNRKTAQMFSICLAFVLFANSSLTLMSRSLADNLRVRMGIGSITTTSLDAAVVVDRMNSS